MFFPDKVDSWETRHLCALSGCILLPANICSGGTAVTGCYKVMADVPSQRSKQGTLQGRLGILATVKSSSSSYKSGCLEACAHLEFVQDMGWSWGSRHCWPLSKRILFLVSICHRTPASTRSYKVRDYTYSHST